MPRILTDLPGDDPVYTDVAGEDIEKRQILEPDPERHGPRCAMCGRDVAARALCAVCGDQDDLEVAA
jgi:hypothetical protein